MCSRYLSAVGSRRICAVSGRNDPKRRLCRIASLLYRTVLHCTSLYFNVPAAPASAGGTARALNKPEQN
eukprot:4976211-Pyramimonas_sp.AAC.1